MDNITVVANGVTVYANGNEFTVNETVVFDGYVSEIYGGSNNSAVDSTSLVLLSGNYTNVYGGSNRGMVFADTSVTVGGNVNSDIDVSDHSVPNTIYGGSNNGIVGGNTYVYFNDNAKSSHIYGGGFGSESVVCKTTNVIVNGGNAMGYYGGSNGGMVSNTNVVVNGGNVEQIFGGCFNASMTGNTSVTVNGGTVTRRIYGGCYNEADYSLLGGPEYLSDYFVTGDTAVIINSGANYTHSGSLECAISAASRNNVNHLEENATLYINSDTVYKNIKSYIGSSLMDIDGYDALYVDGVKK